MMPRPVNPVSCSVFVLMLVSCQAPLQTLSGSTPGAAPAPVVSAHTSNPAQPSTSHQAAQPAPVVLKQELSSQGVPSSDHQHLTAPPQGITAPPQGITAPPQGITAPPLGIDKPLERSQFEFYDKDADQYWNSQELAVYRQDWNAQRQSFSTQSLGDLLNLPLGDLLSAFDSDKDNRLNFSEAQSLHQGLGDALKGLLQGVTSTVGNTVSTVGNLVGGVTSAVAPVTEPLTEAVGNTVGNLVEPVSNLLSPTPSTQTSASPSSGGLIGAVTEAVGSVTGGSSGSSNSSGSGGGLLGSLFGNSDD